MSTISKTSINMPESLHHRVKVACLERKVSFGGAIIEALENWLKEGSHTDRAALAPAATAASPAIAMPFSCSPAEQVWIDKLLYVLRNGDFSRATGLQLSLDCFESIARREKNERK